VLQLVLEQLPEANLDREILVRTDIGGANPRLHRGPPRSGHPLSVSHERTSGRADERTSGRADARGDRKDARPQVASAIDGEGEVRDDAQVIDRVDLSAWPGGTWLIVRERSNPGAQLSVFDCAVGYRRTTSITDQHGADVAVLELRDRRRAGVEDEIAAGKMKEGCAHLPFAAFEHNQVWLELFSDPGAARLAAASLFEASEPSPSPSRCASASCASPGSSPVPRGAPSCACRTPGRGPRRWRRPSPRCTRWPRRVRSLIAGQSHLRLLLRPQGGFQLP
jgi:hypothetical protein